MKYDSGEDYGNGKKYWRKCSLIEKTTYMVVDGPEDMIVDPNNPPKGYFVCDYKIAPIVSALNKKGYITMFSCEGHLDLDVNEDGGNCLTIPFVMFLAGDNFDKYCNYLFRLPRQFEVRIDNMSCENLEDELHETYRTIQEVNPADKRISIYTKCFYSYEENGEFFDSNPDTLTVETFDKYNDRDLAELARWVMFLPDISL